MAIPLDAFDEVPGFPVAALSLDHAAMDRAWDRALNLIRADGLDPEEVIADAARTVGWMTPAGAAPISISARAASWFARSTPTVALKATT